MTEEQDWDRLREKMVQDQILKRGVKDPRVVSAMRSIPRHLFVEEPSLPEAYEDRPLPIGMDQTISQPFIVAYMLERLALAGPEKVLEVGTGSGYQAALLSNLARTVCTVEIVPALAEKAGRRLQSLGISNVEIQIGDGLQGLEGRAPFDRILVSASVPRLPDHLMQQVAPGGWALAPEGPASGQRLVRIVKTPAGLERQSLVPVMFVAAKMGGP